MSEKLARDSERNRPAANGFSVSTRWHMKCNCIGNDKDGMEFMKCKRKTKFQIHDNETEFYDVYVDKGMEMARGMI